MVSSNRFVMRWGSVEEAEPADAFNFGEGFEQRGETVFEAQVFAVAGVSWPMRVISSTPRATSCRASATTDSEAAGAEFAAQVGDDAEGAGVVAAFGDFDVGGGARRGEEARRGFVVEVGGQADGLRPASSSRLNRPCCSRRSPSALNFTSGDKWMG